MMRHFPKWIKQFNEDISAIGDLARMIELDNKFPRSKMYATLISYLRLTDSYHNTIPAFEEAYKEYQTKMVALLA